MDKNSADPLITIIMATFNSSRTLKLAIKTVLAQDFSDFEILVVGDACTDDSEEVVTSFDDIRLNWINLSENSGSQGVPNNEGIKRARGKYIAYLGHDDLWFPWHLSTLIHFIQETDADLVHPLSAVFSTSGLEWTVGPPSFGRTYADHFVFPSCWLHRKNMVDDTGYWGDHLKLYKGVDFEFLRRIYLSGKKISFVPRLSLLKFPSWMWGTYGKDYNPGQLEYSGKLHEDPEVFEKKILSDAAVLLARSSKERISILKAIKQLYLLIIHRIRDIYGSDRWPLKQIMIWRFQRFRKKLKIKRGLSDS